MIHDNNIRVAYNHCTGLVDSGFFFLLHIFEQLVVAIVTLNVLYAGEPVYLVLPESFHLRIVCNLHNNSLFHLIMKYMSYHEVQTIQYMCM